MPTKGITHALRRRFTKSFPSEVIGQYINPEQHEKHKDIVRKEKKGRGISHGNLTGFNVGNLRHAVGAREEKVLKDTVHPILPCPKGCKEADAPHFLFRATVS